LGGGFECTDSLRVTSWCEGGGAERDMVTKYSRTCWTARESIDNKRQGQSAMASDEDTRRVSNRGARHTLCSVCLQWQPGGVCGVVNVWLHGGAAHLLTAGRAGGCWQRRRKSTSQSGNIGRGILQADSALAWWWKLGRNDRRCLPNRARKIPAISPRLACLLAHTNVHSWHHVCSRTVLIHVCLDHITS